MIVGIHQPSYLPWLGYLDKLSCCDLFVIADCRQFGEAKFQHRNRVKVNQGTTWLTVPLMDGPRTDGIRDKRIWNGGSSRQHWQRRTWRTFQIHYGRAPYFRRYADELEEVYTMRWGSLVDLDLHLTRILMRWLKIDCPIVLSSSLNVGGDKTEWIANVCERVGADAYLTGMGASHLETVLDRRMISQRGIRLLWRYFVRPMRYPQQYPRVGFVSNLSAIDLLLNCGPDSRRIMGAGGMTLGDGAQVRPRRPSRRPKEEQDDLSGF